MSNAYRHGLMTGPVNPPRKACGRRLGGFLGALRSVRWAC